MNEILMYLEAAYNEADVAEDVELKVRIRRAIAAFQGDPNASPDEVFTQQFLEDYANRMFGGSDA